LDGPGGQQRAGAFCQRQAAGMGAEAPRCGRPGRTLRAGATVKSPADPNTPPPPRKPMSSPGPSMSDRDGKIWVDGQLVDWHDARIHVLTHTLHYGCGAFEGVRAYDTVDGTAIFRLQEHTERLFNSAKILRMKIPFTIKQVNEA